MKQFYDATVALITAHHELRKKPDYKAYTNPEPEPEPQPEAPTATSAEATLIAALPAPVRLAALQAAKQAATSTHMAANIQTQIDKTQAEIDKATGAGKAQASASGSNQQQQGTGNS